MKINTLSIQRFGIFLLNLHFQYLLMNALRPLIVYASRIPPRHMSTSGQELVAKIVSSNDENALKPGKATPKILCWGMERDWTSVLAVL